MVNENADFDDQIETEPRTSRINSASQKIRGKDLSWTGKKSIPLFIFHHTIFADCGHSVKS